MQQPPEKAPLWYWRPWPSAPLALQWSSPLLEMMAVVSARPFYVEGWQGRTPPLLRLPMMALMSAIPAQVEGWQQSTLEVLQEVQLSQLVGRPGSCRRWQQLPLKRDGQLQQLQPHSRHVRRGGHRQRTIRQTRRRIAQPSLALHTGHYLGSAHYRHSYLCSS